MKILYFLQIILLLNIAVEVNGQFQSANYDKNCADYWLSKMSNPNVNYNDLVMEFNQYWEGKTPDKNSGYKLFRRWQHAKLPFVKPDGYLLPAGQDMIEYNKFLQQNLGENIVGTWDLVGPTIFPQQYYGGQCPGMGRISALAFHPTNSNILFAGAPIGGMWKSFDGGENWNNLNTDDINTMGVSDISIDYTDPNIIYFGTGDRDGWESWGLGVYKSIDGGLTWIQKNTGMGGKTVCKLLMYPDNHNTLIAAANDGIYVTSNGGENWLKVLTTTDPVKDLVFKPGNPNYIYAASKGTIYRSTNYGLTWNALLNTEAHRIVLAVTPANPDKLFALATKDSQFYRFYTSGNSGGTFNEINSSGMSIEGQGGYNLDLAADPNNVNTLYAGMVNVYKSTNGGSSWSMIANTGQIHADQHVFEFSPHTDDYLFIGNDGGVYKMWVGGGNHTVTTISDGLAISEVYRLGTSASNPDLMICGMQDCGSYVTTSNPWLHRFSGDGMNCEIDHNNSNIMYASAQKGHIGRSMDGGNSFQDIAAEGVNGINQSGSWYSAFVLDQFNSNIMFAGFKDVWRSNNVNTSNPSSVSWTNISAGQLSGKVVDLIEQSPVDGNIIFVADEGGSRIFRTSNAYGASPVWTEVTKPYNHRVTWIEAHPTDPDIVYFTITDVVYKHKISTNYWENMTENLPWVSKLCIVYQKNSNEGLYVGTVTGIFYKDAEMEEWVVYKSDLPTTKVYDLEINYHTDPPQLFAATFGRGIWKTDIYPSPKPDLVVTSGNSQISGTQIQVNVGYQNQSQIAYTDPFYIGYYLSSNNVINNSDILIGEQSKPATAPMIIGQGNSQGIDVALISPEIPAGTYYFGAMLDNREELNEISELNNSFTASQQVTIPNAPDPPTNVQASDGTYDNRINITWTAPPNGPWLYTVYRNTENNSATAVKISGDDWIQNTFFDDYDAPRGISIYYWIKASGYEQGLRPSGFSTSNEGWRPLLPPTNVQATDGMYDNKITISWEPSENSLYYRVYRNTVNNSATATNISGFSWILNTTYDDEFVVSGTTYYYWVKAARSNVGLRSSDYSSVNTGWVAFAEAPDLTASDGTYTDHVELVWNSIPGANYYKVFWSLNNDPETSIACTGWQTETTVNYNTGMHGTIVYFWVKASADSQGNVATGYSEEETGWMNFVPPANVQATDGTLLEAINITWNYVSGGSYYRVYRGLNSSVLSALPIGNWFYGNQYLDTTGIPGRNMYYWVRVANDTLVTFSEASAYDIGWGLLDSPTVTATKGVYNDKVEVTWQPVNGGIAYRVFRSEAGNPVIDTLTDWSTSTNYFFEDLTPVMGTYYNYYVTAARSIYGLRESEAGVDLGYADECGNMKEDVAYRSINFHGSTLEVTQRVYNEGPFPFLNPSQVAFTLDAAPWDGLPEYIWAYADIPPLDVNEYYDVQVTVDLDTIPYGPVTYGTWYIGCFMSWDWNNCETNFDDDYVTWTDEPFVFTDAMHGIYTIGPVSGDFYGVDKAILALEERGISDPVTFYLEPTVHFEQNTFGPVTGSEYSKPIIFQTDPAFPDTAEIIFTPTVENNYTLRFSNASNIHFKNLKLSTTGFSNFQSTYGGVIQFTGYCDNIRFYNCLITGFSDNSTYSEDNDVIYCTNSNSNHLYFLNNTIRYGFKGIFLEGMNLATGPLTNIEITHNTIEGFVNTGIELKYVEYPVITENRIISPPTLLSYHFGIDIEYLKGGCDISGNTILLYPSDWAMYGISLIDFNIVDAEQALIYNNFIMLQSNVTFAYGIITANINKTRIYNNSIHLTGNPATFNACVLLDCTAPLSGGYDNSMMNNILSNQLGGYCLGYSDNAYLYQLLTVSDYNNFYSSGPDLFFFKNSYGLQTIDQWWGETGFDYNSLNVNPAFYSDFDLHSNSPDLDGMGYPLAEVLRDIDDEQRHPVHPDMGADEYTYFIPQLDLRVFLEGPFEGGEMKKDLNDAALIPLNQPYYQTPWNYSGTESVASIPENVVDWILIEMYDAPSVDQALPSTLLGRKAALLKSDGSIVDTDGSSNLSFTVPVSNKLFVVIRHRNHIAVLSGNPLQLSEGKYLYDFTLSASQAYGNNQGDFGDKFGMYAGDMNADGTVDDSDHLLKWKIEAGRLDYLQSDVNMDGQADNKDKNDLWFINFGKEEILPE
ncbi:MAG: hypothetical protein JW731_00615 [Bacteroidales bacterium]|nr:hypothetical protein [Bacteroidales bacterium]